MVFPAPFPSDTQEQPFQTPPPPPLSSLFDTDSRRFILYFPPLSRRAAILVRKSFSWQAFSHFFEMVDPNPSREGEEGFRLLFLSSDDPGTFSSSFAFCLFFFFFQRSKRPAFFSAIVGVFFFSFDERPRVPQARFTLRKREGPLVRDPSNSLRNEFFFVQPLPWAPPARSWACPEYS